ncbi:hypothetical protein [Helicobacter sp.]|uniref:ADP-ribosyltransferase-containing protein n=1 Tax=Helicobacter sp. TaxID=218 RepID=UPI002A821358|nr:hypothetical protein [Helicobacter sp.]
MPKAYNHFVKNTYNVDRKEFSGAFLDTLVNPLFIVRQKYRPKVSLQGKSLQRSNNSLDSKMQNKSRIQIGDKEIIQDSYVFYKPFVNENGLVSLASFAISQNGELLHKTFYDIKTISKLKKLIKGDDEDLLYFKNSNVLLNPQELKTISKIQKTYNFNEAKAKDLYEWHKDSNPITKDKNGLPKVFYHGSWKEFEVFQKELTRDYEMPQGSYFSSNKAVAKQYGETLYESFLKVKNPFIIENFGETFEYSRDYIIDKIANIDLSKYDSIILKNIKDNPNGSGGKLADTIIIFDSNQIKHIDNQGSYTDIQGNITKEKPKDKETEHRYFNEKSPNIYYSNPHLGVGLASGSVAGIEEDENGNISFNAEKFVLGMLGGVGGSVSFAKGVKYLKDNPQYKELVAQELSNTLTKGWESAKAKYPLLEALEPRYIIKNEKGRILQSKAILKELFVKEDRILEERLNSFAEPLPKALSKQEFLNQKNRGYNNINTPIGGITINLEHAWEHMNKKNTYKKDRSMYSGAFLDTLTDPLFIVKQEYVPNPKLSANAREMQNSKLVQNKDNQSIAQDSYVFFKPYQLQEKYTYMVGYALDTNGEIINTTFIPMNKRDFGRIKKMLNSNVLYFKERKNDFQYFNEK